MRSLRILMVAALLATTSAYFAAVEAATVTATPKPKAKLKTAKKSPTAKERVCTPVEAVATGFGKANVSNFAFQNLARVIDSAKDALAAKGAKGFAVEQKQVACEDYIDFGGSIGREHKCRAQARVCGQKA